MYRNKLSDLLGYGIGKALLQASLKWADVHNIHKISLQVIATNEKAISIYKKHGFEVDGILKQDKKRSDGQYDGQNPSSFFR
ncbi:GNAT family N-acetyltransferase [Hazenella sp. IB182353]|nr:GNAT family N-acetyltransferase [Polycladospora coralii]